MDQNLFDGDTFWRISKVPSAILMGRPLLSDTTKGRLFSISIFLKYNFLIIKEKLHSFFKKKTAPGVLHPSFPPPSSIPCPSQLATVLMNLAFCHHVQEDSNTPSFCQWVPIYYQWRLLSDKHIKVTTGFAANCVCYEDRTPITVFTPFHPLGKLVPFLNLSFLFFSHLVSTCFANCTLLICCIFCVDKYFFANWRKSLNEQTMV